MKLILPSTGHQRILQVNWRLAPLLVDLVVDLVVDLGVDLVVGLVLDLVLDLVVDLLPLWWTKLHCTGLSVPQVGGCSSKRHRAIVSNFVIATSHFKLNTRSLIPPRHFTRIDQLTNL